MNREERLHQDGVVTPILFFHPDEPYGVFSNFSDHPIVLPCPWTGEPIVYSTTEHRFQAMKAITKAAHDHINEFRSPGTAKNRGRQTRLREDWGDDLHTICWYVMLEALIAKVQQHSTMREALRRTATAHIYEDSPTDDIWGWRTGAVHNGKNLLGEALMHVRQLLILPPVMVVEEVMR